MSANQSLICIFSFDGMVCSFLEHNYSVPVLMLITSVLTSKKLYPIQPQQLAVQYGFDMPKVGRVFEVCVEVLHSIFKHDCKIMVAHLYLLKAVEHEF